MEDVLNDVNDEDIQSGKMIFLGHILSKVLDLEETKKK